MSAPDEEVDAACEADDALPTAVAVAEVCAFGAPLL
jgi:hypothetical protein